jgi:hypothetical protein
MAKFFLCKTWKHIGELLYRVSLELLTLLYETDRTMDPGSIQPRVKMSTRNIPGGKGGRCVRLTTSPPSRAECHEIWEPKPPWKLWAKQGLLRGTFTFYYMRRFSGSFWKRIFIQTCFRILTITELLLFGIQNKSYVVFKIYGINSQFINWYTGWPTGTRLLLNG